MYTLKFKKYEDDKWYIELPDWKGPHENLQMVAGADKLCEEVSEMMGTPNIAYVNAVASTKPILHDNADILLIKQEESKSGAYYNVCGTSQFRRPIRTPNIWICPVTLEVFGAYPDYIQLFPTFIDDEVFNG